METLIVKAIEQLITGSPVFALMIWAIIHFKKASEVQASSNQQLIEQMQAERSERLDDMEQDIIRQRERTDECEKDRLNLYKIIGHMEMGQFRPVESPSLPSYIPHLPPHQEGTRHTNDHLPKPKPNQSHT